jgi:oligosaccharide repeat unit polymerase
VHYIRSGRFIIHIMAAWWVLWLAVAMTPLNSYVAPSWGVTAQFAALVLFFLMGHALVKLLDRPPAPVGPGPAIAPPPFVLRRSLHALNWACLLILLVSLYLSGAFTEGFIEYFIKLRGEEITGDSLTGSRLLDVSTKALVFPAAYTLTTVILALRVGPYRWVLAVAIANIVLFSYLWQVNYSLIHLFWFFVFYIVVGIAHGSLPNRKTLVFAVLLFALLVAVAANRFGGGDVDVMGGLRRYVLGYHMAGFSFYEHHFQNPASLLHEHTFGRSSLGFIEQVLEIISRRIDLGFVAASSDNANYNNDSIDLGATEVIPGNAFGTFLFGFYRDFNLVGIALGGLLYGGFTTYLLARSKQRWHCAAVFYVLASAWMVGMLVNPIEQAHFWFSIILIGILSVANRGFKL